MIEKTFDDLANKIKQSIHNLNSNLDSKCVAVTEGFYMENQDKILKMGERQSDIKIFKISDSINMTELVKNYEKNEKNSFTE